jgi:hypothetical protein
MKTLLTTVSILLFTTVTFAQSINQSNESPCGDVVYYIVEKAPEYKGGIDQLELELNKSLTLEKKTKYDTFINFRIDCEGNISNFICQGNGDKELNDKLIEALKKNKNWEPGLNKGKKVTCSKTVGFHIKKGTIQLEDYKIK